MPILWGDKPTAQAPACPSCRCEQVVETGRGTSAIFFRCVACWWLFVVLRPPVTTH